MKRTLIGLAASAAMVTLSAGAFAAVQLDKSDTAGAHKAGAMTLAQASGQAGGNGPAATMPEEQVGGKRRTETDKPGAMTNPNAMAVPADSDSVDASQSKRNETTSPAESGSK